MKRAENSTPIGEPGISAPGQAMQIDRGDGSIKDDVLDVADCTYTTIERSSNNGTRKMKNIVIATSMMAFSVVAQAHGSYYHDSLPGRTAIQLRYVSDPTVPTVPPDPVFCAAAPFEANGYVEGHLTAYRLRVKDDTTRLLPDAPRNRRGFARACIQITDFEFKPFASPVPIYWQLDIDDIGTITAEGQCLSSNNNVPQEGVILGGCVMTIVYGPEGYLGGNVVESGVVFNPFSVPDFETSSSYFTIHLFE